MTKTRRVAVFIFAMVLVVLMSVPSSADIVSSNKASGTIDVQLKSLLKNSSAEERIPVSLGGLLIRNSSNNRKASADNVCGGFPLFPLDFFLTIRYYIV